MDQEQDYIDQYFNQVVGGMPYQDLKKLEAAPAVQPAAPAQMPERDLLTESIVSLGPAILGGLSGESGAIAQAPASRQVRDQYEARRKEEGAYLAKNKELEAKRAEAVQKQAQVGQQNKRQDEMMGLKREELNIRRLAAQKDGVGSGATDGTKAVDKDYAKDYNDWTSAGRATVDKNLEKLRNAKAALQKDPSLTGPIRGNTPDFLRNLTNESAITTRDDVRSAAQGALKAALGNSFTEKEGERIMNAAYNEKLSPEANMAKIDAAIKEIETTMTNNDKKAQFFQKNRTLNGLSTASESREQFPMTVRKGKATATISSADELKEAQAEGWQ